MCVCLFFSLYVCLYVCQFVCIFVCQSVSDPLIYFPVTFVSGIKIYKLTPSPWSVNLYSYAEIVIMFKIEMGCLTMGLAH